jgi:hypothetical protein
MGIGDFGVGESGLPYTYNTTEFLGNFSWTNLSLSSGGDTEFTDQLNVVLQFVQGGTTYAYWIQDVVIMDSSSGALEFENNIWNFSSTSYCLSNSDVTGNGTVYAYKGCEGYYAVLASTQPGATEDMPSPGDFSLLVRSYLSSGGVPEVAFEYWDGVTSYEVTYDNVVWPWATAVTADNGFYVDGNSTAPSGNFYDAELAMGGPGGGSSTVAGSLTKATSKLLYWNGHNFEAPRSVWNFGADTGETISNAQSIFWHDSGGTPLTTQLNGTTRNATPAQAYDQGRVGVLAISASGLSSGSVSVNGTSWAFRAGEATLTLVPGTYHVWVNSSSQQNNLGLCEIVGGETDAVSLPGTCSTPSLSTSTPTGTPASVDIGQTVVFQTTASGGSGGNTFNWSALAAGLGCARSTTGSISCSPTKSGVYSVAVTVTDSKGNSYASGSLQYTVHSDPAVGAPTANPSSTETGLAVSISVSPSGGSGGYSYSWTNLPTPCTGTTTSSPECHPAMAGVYSILVTVTDSVGGQSTSSPLAFTVTPGVSIGSVTSSPAAIDLGSNVTLSAVGVSGGTGPYTYSWSDLPAGCSSAETASITCAPRETGTFAPSVTVRDADGDNATLGANLTVVSDPSISSIGASHSSVDVGQTVVYTAEGVAGGLGGDSYVWSGLPTGCATVNSTTLSCAPNEAGNFLVTVTVTDQAHFFATQSLEYSVHSLPTVSAASASSTSVPAGQTVVLTADVTGGSGGLTYQWSGLPPGCASTNSSTLNCAPTTTGSYAVAVTVEDSNGGSATSPAVPIVVTSDSSSSTPFSSQLDGLLLTGGLVAGLAALIFFAGPRKRTPPGRIR